MGAKVVLGYYRGRPTHSACIILGQGNLCSQPITPGNCRGYFPRYGFDQATGQCKSFVYGGCGGNSNNFETLEDCKAACGKQNKRERFETSLITQSLT